MNSSTTEPRTTPRIRLVAVVDMGATSVRMAVAEIVASEDSETRFRMLENMSQSVSLGNDSFLAGKIERSTIEDCVRVLSIYRRKLDEYGITHRRDIRVVATSAVSEASNRLSFQDRIFIATGFEIESFDAAELHRVTYLGILPFLDSLAPHPDDHSVVCEIGGGSTEMLILKEKNVRFSNTFRTGGLRLRRTLEAFHMPINKLREVIQTQVSQIVSEVKDSIPNEKVTRLVAMGGEMRFLASEILNQNPASTLVQMPIDLLHDFNTENALLAPEKLVRKFNLSFPEAQTLGPSLLAYELIATDLDLESIYVANVNLRDGLLTEMVAGNSWSPSIEDQILQSAISVGRKYHLNEKRSLNIAELARQMFEQLNPLHQLDSRHGFFLYLAALLHEIGLYIGSRSYHKHSMYLIRNSEFFGLGSHDTDIISLVARYHRRASPQPSHEGYSRLRREKRAVVSKLAAILRIARALDAQRIQRISEIQCTHDQTQVTISVGNISDAALERFELNQCNNFFESIFGRRVLLVNNR